MKWETDHLRNQPDGRCFWVIQDGKNKGKRCKRQSGGEYLCSWHNQHVQDHNIDEWEDWLGGYRSCGVRK